MGAGAGFGVMFCGVGAGAGIDTVCAGCVAAAAGVFCCSFIRRKRGRTSKYSPPIAINTENISDV